MNVSIPRFLAMLFAGCLALPASAAEKLVPVEIVFGPPGELTIDATGPKKLLPIPEETRTFVSRDQYLDWLEKELNALVYEDEGGTRVYELAVTAIGTPAYYDASHGLIDVPSPHLWLVGGRSGHVVIEGTLECVNPYICHAGDLEFSRREFPMIPGVNVGGALVAYPIHDGTEFRGNWRTEIATPPTAKVIEMLGGNACEGCQDEEGNLHCRTFECGGQGIFWTLGIEPRVVEGDGTKWVFRSQYGYNEAMIDYTQEFPASGKNRLAEAEGLHAGTAVFYRPGTDYTHVKCDSTGRCVPQ